MTAKAAKAPKTKSAAKRAPKKVASVKSTATATPSRKVSKPTTAKTARPKSVSARASRGTSKLVTLPNAHDYASYAAAHIPSDGENGLGLFIDESDIRFGFMNGVAGAMVHGIVLARRISDIAEAFEGSKDDMNVSEESEVSEESTEAAETTNRLPVGTTNVALFVRESELRAWLARK